MRPTQPVEPKSRGATTMKSIALAITAALLSASPALAEQVGSVDTAWSLFKDHKVTIEAFDDRDVPGVTCYVSRARTGGAAGALGVASDPSEASIACRQTGPINATGLSKLKPGQDVFDAKADLLFKTIHVSRFYDAKRNVLLYLTWSGKLIDGSPKNSLSAVTIRPWAQN
ncbi:catabolite regulation protein CreA [Thioclava sp. BHET1]|nr:catabolite regulation protein CreA [Thioclava sp. BHET1]